ncbi:MAG: glycerol-3-phosphate dehydrogenase/oxidase [Bacteroidetes bacterium]|nr:glycerol-3-phosphate dehydrogenase/oxidase [Bacteroidota bacterium]
MNRETTLHLLQEKNKVWDLAIIGGGASGLGVALDAVSRGLSVTLFEKADFAKGTSSRSTKLIHGGVRYLGQGQASLVIEALKERGFLLKNAPHLTSKQSFLIPIYTWWDRIQYSIGLKLYDWMAGSLSLGPSKFISKEETLRRLPTLQAGQLQGAVRYYDGQFDDARLAINLAQTAEELGACLLNYAKITELSKDANGKLTGLKVRDMDRKESFHIQAKMIVNATGVFADKILQLDNPQAPKTIQPSQGIHLILDLEFLGGNDALMIPKTKDGRVLFGVPWHGKLLLGTTDTIREKAKLEPEALQEEIDFVLETASAYLTRKPGRKDVKAVFAGLRPLAIPKEGSTKTKEISRSHKIIISPSGLVSLIGGKWTTFRKMGEDTVSYFTQVTGQSIAASTTSTQRIHGYTETIPPGHWGIYGSDAQKIQALAVHDPSLAELIHPNFPHILAEVVWACQSEMALTVEDVLSRRIRLLILDPEAAVAAAERVARIMAKVLQKKESWIASELIKFNKIAEKYMIHTP